MGIDVITGKRKRGPNKMFAEQVELGLTAAQLAVLAKEGERLGVTRAALIRAAINEMYLPEAAR